MLDLVGSLRPVLKGLQKVAPSASRLAMANVGALDIGNRRRFLVGSLASASRIDNRVDRCG